jgi:DNA mismatch endonuclease, patch repair protein
VSWPSVPLRAPPPTSPSATAVGRGNRRRDTRPELSVRSALHHSGARYRVDYLVQAGAIRVRPDIVFPRRHVAIFIDGCFWHGCSAHGTTPRSNSSYWIEKLKRNVERDQRVTAALQADGWRVARFWEHQPVDVVVARILNLLPLPGPATIRGGKRPEVARTQESKTERVSSVDGHPI